MTTTAALAAARPAWDALFDRAAGASTFTSHEWLHAWWTCYRPTAELHVLLCEDDTGGLVGIAPLMAQTETRAGVSTRTLRFLGDGTSETDHMDFLVQEEQRERVLGRLLDHVAADPGWDIARLNQIPADSPTVQVLEAWARRRGYWLERETVASPVRRLPDTFEALLASLQPRLRTTVRSSRRRLAERHRVEFGMLEDPAHIPGALATLFALHGSRWRTRGEAGAFADERRRRFYEALTPALLARGWLRLYHLALDGKVVAQQYCFEHAGTVMLLQEGFDPAYAADNVGHVLRAAVLERLIAERKQAYDFLAGDSRHKRLWADADRPDVRLTVARRRVRAGLALHLPRWGAAAKARVQPRLPAAVLQLLRKLRGGLSGGLALPGL